MDLWDILVGIINIKKGKPLNNFIMTKKEIKQKKYNEIERRTNSLKGTSGYPKNITLSNKKIIVMRRKKREAV